MENRLLCGNLSLRGDSAEAKRVEVLNYFLKTYEIYELLFEILKNDSAFYEQPEKLRHPLIFYFGHTAAFYINKLTLAKKTSRINERFESIFAIGVDEMSWDDLDGKNYNWPSVDEAREYRRLVRERVTLFIQTEPISLPIGWDDPFWIILMGIEHERIHLETSSVLIRQLDISFIKEHSLFKICAENGKAPQNEMLKVLGGEVILGKNFSDDYYGWDNEYGVQQAKLESFEASKYLVSNGEFLEFVEDNGYDKDEFWEAEGLSWKKFAGAKFPVFWIVDKESIRYRALTKIIEMPFDWPVDVNYHEAKAFCNWKSKKTGKNIRLPSESEWNRLYEYCKLTDDNKWQTHANANINLEHFASSCPVNKFLHGGFYDIIGNIWQWSETPIYGFDGFKTHPIYDDFSTPTFDDRHNIMLGGSFISTGNETLKSSRYAFRRHFFQHAGFRYVDSRNSLENTNSIYETDELISQYLEFHYGDEYFGVSNFHKKVAEVAIGVSEQTAQKRALDIGCSVGRVSFELARVFDEVVGLDFSARFIRCGDHLKRFGEFKYKIKTEGDLLEERDIQVKEIGISEEQMASVVFLQGDACNLKPHLRDFDLIVAANLIDRLYDPIKFLTHIHTRLNKGGILILSSPYSWDELYTKRDLWLTSNSKKSLGKIREILEPNFDEIYEPMEIEFVIRESSRKFQHTISELTIWQKK